MSEWLSVSAWSRAVGISRQAGHAAVRRLGIEVIDGKLDAALATRLYRSGTRPQMRMHRSRQVPAHSVGELLDLATGIAEILDEMDTGAEFDTGARHLMNVLGHLPEQQLHAIKLPQRVVARVESMLDD